MLHALRAEGFAGRLVAPGESVNIPDASLSFLDGDLLTPEDLQWIEACRSAEIHHYMLSFTESAQDVLAVHEADPEAALALTEAAFQAHKAEGDKTTNLAYRTLVEQRTDLHVAAGRPAQARKELSSLAPALSRRGANPNVVADVKAQAESLGK